MLTSAGAPPPWPVTCGVCSHAYAKLVKERPCPNGKATGVPIWPRQPLRSPSEYSQCVTSNE
eukprot:1589782-Prymnesium_polylepis.1